MSDGALSDLTVIDVSQGVAGPFCAKLLGDYGADVIKVEPPTGDRSRRHGPFPGDIPHPEKSGQFLYLNANKRGLTLDLASEGGRAVLCDLLSGADVLVIDLMPAELDGLELNFTDLHPLNPRLIMVAISPFGQTGPYRDYRGTDLTLFQAGGMGRETPYNEITDLESSPPLRAGGYQADYVTGLTAASAAMVAVAHRTAYGEGQLVDLGGMESVANMMRFAVANYSHNPALVVPTRLKSSTGWVLPCKDGYLSFSPFQFDHWWRSFREMMGNPEWAESEVFDTAAGRAENFDVLEPFMIEWLMEHSKMEVYEMALAREIACFPVNTMEEVVSSRQFNAREFLRAVTHPVAGCVKQPGPPAQFRGTPWEIRRPAPLLGQHNEEVLYGRLAYPAEKMAALRTAGAIGQTTRP